MWDLVPQPGIQPWALALGARSLSHWTTREVPQLTLLIMGLPGGSDGEVSACNAEDLDLIPVSGRSPGEGNGNPLQYSCLENPTDGAAW